MITREKVAEQLAAYLYHEINLSELVHWAERAMMEEDFAPEHFEAIRDVVSHLGVADVRAFGLTWEDCEQLLNALGYNAEVRIVVA
jgi:hypothetical protein